MIDPSKITNYNLTNKELEERILFWVCAAGKNGTTAARLLDKFLVRVKQKNFGPFKSILHYLGPHGWSYLPFLLKECGIGCYNSKAKTFAQLVKSGIDLKTCTADDLEKIHGIGMKTSRCFIMHSRRNARYAGLDTHILKYLKSQGASNVPKSTPGSKKEYKRLEQEFLKLADKAKKSPADFDLEIWNKYSVKST